MDESKLPKLDKDETDRVVQLFKDVYQPATSITSAFVRTLPGSTNLIISEWSQRSLERGTSLKISRTTLTDAYFTTNVEVNTVDISNSVLNAVSPSGKLKAVVHTSPSDDPKIKTKYYLDIWNEQKSLMTFDLAALDLHGPVYTDEMFRTLSWSRQDDKVVYVAEKKLPKTAPFYQQKSDSNSKDDKNDTLVGEQYAYEDDWGEQMSPKTHPVIVVCDVNEKKIALLDGVPENTSSGQVIWDPSGTGVVGIGTRHTPRRLGIIYCTNRQNCIFHLTLDGKYTALSDEKMSALCPRFSPDGKYLVWLQRPIGGPHHSAFALVKCDWATKEVKTVVDIVNTVTKTANSKEFYGIFSSALPLRCWTADSKYVLLSTDQAQRVNSYAINIEDGGIWDIGSSDEYESTSILDVSENNFVICSKSSFLKSPVLASMYVPAVIAGLAEKPVWKCLTKATVEDDESVIYKSEAEPYHATFFGPRNGEKESTPLILYPHGGPHSSASSTFSPALHFFKRLGFGILVVNFRGSTGYGKDYVEALLGKVGTLDANDCHAALKWALSRFSFLDAKNVFVFGGSHGGFLATHLSSQYPDEFKGVVAINPVISIPAMLYTSDIPDWTLVESGFSYDGIADVIRTPQIWQKMAEISPIFNVRKVKAPTLLLLGKKDLRVPSSQGLSYYHALKECNVETKLFYYEDNHSLRSIPVEMDFIINAALWFIRCSKRL